MLLCLTYVIYGLFVLIWCIIMLQYSILDVFAPFIWHNLVKTNMVFLVFWLILHILWWIFKWKSLLILFFSFLYMGFFGLRLGGPTHVVGLSPLGLTACLVGYNFLNEKNAFLYFQACLPNVVFKQFLSL